MSRAKAKATPQPKLKVATTYPALAGAVLVSLRKRRHFRQVDVANCMGLAGSTWSRIENGSSALTLSQLAHIAKLFNTTPSDLLAEVDYAVLQANTHNVLVLLDSVTLENAAHNGLVLLQSAALQALIK